QIRIKKPMPRAKSRFPNPQILFAAVLVCLAVTIPFLLLPPTLGVAAGKELFPLSVELTTLLSSPLGLLALLATSYPRIRALVRILIPPLALSFAFLLFATSLGGTLWLAAAEATATSSTIVDLPNHLLTITKTVWEPER